MRPGERFDTLSVFWRVFLVDLSVLGAAALVLAVGPVTISYPVHSNELIGIVVGLVGLMLVSTFLLSRTLRPLRTLIQTMREVDLLSPGRRVDVPHAGADVKAVVQTFNEMLQRLERERRESGRMALSIQESERRRVARELHDEIGQTLTAMLLQIEGLSSDLPERTRGELDELRETARTGAEDVRRIAQRLRPEALEELGLQAALLALTTSLAGQSGIPIERHIDRDLPLGADDELVVYRVAQEALTNVVRHSWAKSASLSLTARGRSILLCVADDGAGAGAAQLESSFGIRGMRERALLVGAILDIESTVGRGTVVRLQFPIPERP
jgi:two-component system, NarL family, sensor histidine kinase UhpB